MITHTHIAGMARGTSQLPSFPTSLLHIRRSLLPAAPQDGLQVLWYISYHYLGGDTKAASVAIRDKRMTQPHRTALRPRSSAATHQAVDFRSLLEPTDDRPRIRGKALFLY